MDGMERASHMKLLRCIAICLLSKPYVLTCINDATMTTFVHKYNSVIRNTEKIAGVVTQLHITRSKSFLTLTVELNIIFSQL